MSVNRNIGEQIYEYLLSKHDVENENTNNLQKLAEQTF